MYITGGYCTKVGRGVVALYTFDSRYAGAFLNYNIHNEKEKIIVKIFTNEESLEYSIKNDSIDLLLVDGTCMDGHIESMPCSKAVLSRKKYITKSQHPAIFMYQKADVIFRQIYDILSEKSVENRYCCAAQNIMPKITGVFSPCYPIERGQFARALAECAGEKEKVLYLNISEFEEEDTEYDKGLSELLLFIQQEGKSMVYKLPAMVRQTGTYDSLAGVRHYQDIRDISADDIVRLIKQFELIDEYSRIIINIGLLGEPAYCIFGYCDEILMPVNSKIAYGRQEHLRRDIKLEGKEGVWKHIREINVPEGWYKGKETREKWMRNRLAAQK